MNNGTATSVDRRAQQAKPASNPLSEAKLSAAAKPSQTPTSAPKSPSASFNDLSMSPKARQALRTDSPAAKPVAAAVVATPTSVVSERRAAMKAAEQRKVTTRVTQEIPQTVVDRFITWLAKTLKALIDRFTPKNQAFKFGKVSSLSAQLKKNVNVVEVGKGEDAEPSKEPKSADKEVLEGPGVK